MIYKAGNPLGLTGFHSLPEREEVTAGCPTLRCIITSSLEIIPF